MKTAKELLQAYIDGTAQQSAALFAEKGALEITLSYRSRRGPATCSRRPRSGVWREEPLGGRRIVVDASGAPTVRVGDH